MTLKDVAVISGCSVATVCKVFKNSAEISEQTKKQVLAAAKKCGYIKKATKHTAVLGGIKTVILADENYKLVGKIEQINTAFARAGYTLLYVNVNEKKALELFEQTGAVGIAVFEGKASGEAVLSFSDINLDFVTELVNKLKALKPKRTPRSTASNKGEKISPPFEQKREKEVTTPKEEIWLL